MTGIISVDNDWLKGIAKYLSIGVSILASTNLPVAAAITTADIMFDIWKKQHKTALLSKKKAGIMGNPIVEWKTEPVEDIPLTKKKIKDIKKDQKRRKKGRLTPDEIALAKLKVPLKLKKGGINF